MNEDLKLRLKHRTNVSEEAFFWALTDELWRTCRDSDRNGRKLVVDVHEINTDEDDTGYVVEVSYDDHDEFYMVLDSRIDFGTRCDYLIHEMAHIDCWERTKDKEEDHCMVWGVSYAKLYRRYLNFYNEYWENNE
jgi:hypothetical protein